MLYTNRMKGYTLNELPCLDEVVLAALELMKVSKLPELALSHYQRPMFVGSGNAAATGAILGDGLDAVFADESSYQQKLAAIKEIDAVILISASGDKHAPGIAKFSRAQGKPVFLLTCNPQAPAGKSATFTCLFPKQREPYTFNTSTYLGMILSKTNEDPSHIISVIQELSPKLEEADLTGKQGYVFVVPPRFDLIRTMYQTKFIELFGRKIARDFFTTEQLKHATTVVCNNEIMVNFGPEPVPYPAGTRCLEIPLPPNAGFGLMMALGYYVIGKIQHRNPPWFEHCLPGYCKTQGPKLFGKEIDPIVQ